MRGRTNLVLRLNHLARQIDHLAERLRKPGYDPEDSSTLWSLCAAHQRLLRELAEEASGAKFARGTERIVPLPKNTDPIWKAEGKTPGIVAAMHAYLSEEEEETTAVEVPERLQWNLEQMRKGVDR